MKHLCRTGALALLFAMSGPVAHARKADEAAPSVGSPSMHSLWTFVFLDNLALERHVDPSPLCHQLYVDLDKSLDRLIDTSDWQRLAWQFSRSGIYETLDGLQNEDCDEDLSHDPKDESEACLALREQGRRQLYMMEHSKSGQAIIDGHAMHAFQAHINIGRATGCLTPHHEEDTTTR